MFCKNKKQQNAFNSKRLDASNINQYLSELYPQAKTKRAIKSKTIDMNYYIQDDYGLANDCTLTSLMTVLLYYLKYDRNEQEVYDLVERIAKKYGYKNNGTNPLAIKRIYDTAAGQLGLSAVIPTYSGYMKNIGYKFEKIMNLIDNKVPAIISVNNDGRNYYRNHSMTIIGYTIYRITLVDGQTINRRFLKVYDNWRSTFGYIDYEVLSSISSINY